MTTIYKCGSGPVIFSTVTNTHVTIRHAGLAFGSLSAVLPLSIWTVIINPPFLTFTKISSDICHYDNYFIPRVHKTEV
ncbi:hypothetical protein BDR04DRAFT_136715 [Suillus decipiens]|nr:hypothetical protein BDR04DRAFT_136715 [Suillus decipiens]